MGIAKLSKSQLGREVTAGTPVAATSVWRGIGRFEDQLKLVQAKENIGYLSGTDRAYIPELGGKYSMEAVEATFEQLPHILDAGIMVATGVKDGPGTDYIYTYNFPTTAQPTIKTYTIEDGDDSGAEEMEYSFVSEFTLAGKARDAWMVSAEWQGRQLTPTTYTGALSVATVEEPLFSKTKLYIEAIGGTWGTTLKSNTLLEATLKYKTGLVPVFTGDGALYFSFHKCIGPEVTLDITFEHDATAIAEKVNWRAKTPRLIQLKCEGAAPATPGTTYTVKTMIINLAGKWEKFDKIGESDGNDVIKATFFSRYNPTGAKFGQIIVTPELATIP